MPSGDQWMRVSVAGSLTMLKSLFRNAGTFLVATEGLTDEVDGVGTRGAPTVPRGLRESTSVTLGPEAFLDAVFLLARVSCFEFMYSSCEKG